MELLPGQYSKVDLVKIRKRAAYKRLLEKARNELVLTQNLQNSSFKNSQHDGGVESEHMQPTPDVDLDVGQSMANDALCQQVLQYRGDEGIAFLYDKEAITGLTGNHFLLDKWTAMWCEKWLPKKDAEKASRQSSAPEQVMVKELYYFKV